MSSKSQPSSPATTQAPEARRTLRRRILDLFPVRLGEANGGILVDAGDHGLGVQAVSPPVAGEQLDVRLAVTGTADEIAGACDVIWSDAGGRAGLRLREMSPENRSHYERWLTQLKEVNLDDPVPDRKDAAFVLAGGSGSIETLRTLVSLEEIDEASALAVISQAARERLRATGAAIALLEGDAMVCRASNGNAPPLGVKVESSTGLSGECLRSGGTVICTDAEIDPRVNAAACRALNLRSALVVPMHAEGKMAGLLEVFSDQPNAFGGQDALILQEYAALAAKAVRPADRSKALSAAAVGEAAANPLPSAQLGPPDAVAAVPTGSGSKTDFKLAADSAKRLPATGSPLAPPPDGNQGIPIKAPPPAGVPVHWSGSSAAAAKPAPLAGPPPAAIKPPSSAPETVTPPVFGRTARPTALVVPASRSSRKLVAAGASVLLLLAGVLAWQATQGPTSLPAPAPLGAAAEPAPPGGAAESTERGPEASANAARPSTPTSQPAMTAAPQTAPAAQPVPTPRAAAQPNDTRTAVSPEAAPGQPQASPPVPVRLPEPVSQAETGSDPTPPPAAEIMPATATPVVIQPTAPAPVLPAPVRQSRVQPGELIQQIPPVYPAMARNAGISGAVVLKAKVGLDGRVMNVQVVSGHPLLGQAAMDAVRRWRYTPFRLNGQPVESELEVRVVFR